MVKISEDDSSAVIDDATLRHHKQAPKDASFVDVNAKLTRVRWKIPGAIGRGGALADLEYRLYYKHKNGRAHLDFRARGYPNTERGNGRCEVIG